LQKINGCGLGDREEQRMLPVQSYDESDVAMISSATAAMVVPTELDPVLSISAHRLIKRYEEIMQTLDADVADVEDSGRPHFSNHLAEDASDAQEWQSRAALAHHLTEELHAIEHAYALLQRGQYGLCEQCGHSIPPRRLAIIPSATMCVQCQGRADQMAAGH
jgi:DnaK suppressor protein